MKCYLNFFLKKFHSQMLFAKCQPFCLCLNVLTYCCLVMRYGIADLAQHWFGYWLVITLRPRQNGRHFAEDIFKCIFLNENVSISIKISLKFVPKGPINNIPALVQIMAWHWPGDRPLSELMMVNLSTHICVTRPQWVNWRHQAITWTNVD